MRKAQRSSRVLAVVVVLLIGVFGGPAAAEEPADLKALVEGNNAFALSLYAKLKESDGNLFFSPHSISTALAMTYAGARGNTERQMAEVLRFTLSQDRLHRAFASLESDLNGVQKKGNVELSVANALWIQKGYALLPDFLNLTKSCYGAPPNTVDFAGATEAARALINRWAEEKTKGKIKDLLARRVVDEMTHLVLANAIYFKGAWASQFAEHDTKEQPFWVAEGNSVQVPMMSQLHTFRRARDYGVEILELPYVGNDLSMIVMLPSEIDGLPKLEAALSLSQLNAWLSRLEMTRLRVILPRFEMAAELRLCKTLASMGMPDAFGENADFSGMDGTKELFISAVVHKAHASVDEKGTEAAAATAVVMAKNGELSFIANHPFVFLIRDNRSGSILFLGRVVNPKETTAHMRTGEEQAPPAKH